jgi:hypothetical protein
MDAWTALNSRQTARPRFDSLRDHVDIKAFLERRRNNMTVHEISEEPSNQTKDEDRSSPDEGRNEHGSRNTTPDTGFESRRGSLVSQVVHWGRPESRNNSIPSLPHHPGDQFLSPHMNYPVMPQLTPVLGLGGDTKRHHHYHHHHHHRKGKSSKERIMRMFWLIGCLTGSFVHFFVTTIHYMKYETATETVTGMPLAVKIPATAVCFPIWSLIHKEKLKNDSACLDVRTMQAIEDCEAELFGLHYTIHYLLHNLTMNPIDLIHWIEIRKPSRKLGWIRDEDLIDASPHRRYRRNQTNVKSYYKGPDKCISFHPLSLDPVKEPDQLLSIDRMATAKSRVFFFSAFRVSPEMTPQIRAVRLYVHESGSYPRGSAILPIVANLTNGLSFTISYTKIETMYLPAPFFSKCVDYGELAPRVFGDQILDSKQHCTSRCVRHKTKSDPDNPAIPSDHLLMRDISSLTQFELSTIKFMPSQDDSMDEVVQECAERCNLDCITRNYYTSLSEADIAQGPQHFLSIKTRLENPETTVKFIPKLDFEAYIIYVAGVFSIWFSASVYHCIKDAVISSSHFVCSHPQLFLQKSEQSGKKKHSGYKLPVSDANNNNSTNVMSY